MCGTEVGVFVSHDSGANWAPLMNGMPVVPVHDLVFHGDDVVAATHGRGFYVLDLVTPLRAAASMGRPGKASLFPVASATTYSFGSATRGVGANPPSGVVVDYYLAGAATNVELAFFDKSGRQVAKIEGKKEAGHHRASTSLRYPGYRTVPGMVFWAAGPRPIKAPPGDYTCRLTVDGETHEVPFRLQRDPRYPGTDLDLVAQFELSERIAGRVTQANMAVVLLREAVKLVGAQRAAAPGEVDAFVTRANAAMDAIHQGKSVSSQDPLNHPIRVNNKLAALLGSVQSGEWRPTEQALAVFADLSSQLDSALAECKALVDGLEALNAKIRASGGEAVVLPQEIVEAAKLGS
jgi:hypothetical protein